MSTVIYADTLIAVNFSMDFLSLFICAKLTKAVSKPLRLSSAALVGAVVSLCTTVISAYVALGIAEYIIAAASACVMVLCAFGGTRKNVLRNAVTFFAVNIGLGGLMTALFSMLSSAAGDSRQSEQAVADIPPAVFAAVAIISGAVSLIYGKYRQRTSSQKSAEAVITVFGSENKLTLLSDSGHLLRDPFTGKSVIVISHGTAEKWLPKSGTEAARNRDPIIFANVLAKYRPRMIPADSVTGTGLLIGFVPDRITVDGAELDAVVAIDTVSDDYNGYGGLIPQELLTK